jgi:hypothetical protein
MEAARHIEVQRYIHDRGEPPNGFVSLDHILEAAKFLARESGASDE